MILLEFCALVSLVIPSARAAGSPQDEASLLRKAPEFQGLDWLEQSRESWISKLRGNVVVLLFWNSGDRGSQDRSRKIQSLARDLEGKGVRFYGISIEGEATLRENASALGLEFPLALDNSAKTFRRYGIGALPTVVLIDPHGRIAETVTPERIDGLDKALTDLVRPYKEILDVRVALDQALECLDTPKLPEAIRSLKDLAAKAHREPRLVEEALGQLNRIEAQATDSLVQSHRAIEDGYFKRGVAILEGVASRYEGTYSGAAAQAELRRLRQTPRYQREGYAEALLEAAKDHQRKGEKAKMREALRSILKKYPETDSAKEAEELLKREPS